MEQILSAILFVILGDASWFFPIFIIFFNKTTILKEYNFLKIYFTFFGGINFCIL